MPEKWCTRHLKCGDPHNFTVCGGELKCTVLQIKLVGFGSGEVVALVTGIIGCATSLATIAPQFREPLRKCYQDLVEKLSYMKDTRRKLNTLDKAITYGNIVEESVLTSEIRDFCNSLSDQDFDCLFGYLPNYYKRYSIGKKIAEINVRLKRSGVQLKPRETGEQQYFRNYRYLVGHQTKVDLEEIRRFISDYSIIAVSGAIGIGKTKFVAHFCKIREQDDPLIWVEASYEDDVKMLQMKLASKMGLSLSSDNTVAENADLLYVSLKKMKGFLIVLDNLWKAFSLEEIGIPVGSSGRKIILISRSSSVCSQMRSEKIIELKLISDAEAYRLLKLELDHDNVRDLSYETEFILKKIAEECGGLPLAIKMVAEHLRKLNWNDSVTIEKALKNQLAAFKESAGVVKYIDDKIFEDFVHSYEQLKNSRYSCTQECFLWCIIYPRNTVFIAKELVGYWMWEGLLGEVERIDKMLGEAEEILDELKNVHLLESIAHENGVEMVKLHPFIWDMAVQSIKGNSKFFIKAGRGLRKPLYGDWHENVERVSLMKNDIKELRSGPNFGKLSTLLLQCNPINLPIHNKFFNSMPNLKILDLSNTGIGILPESVSCLKNLIALLLRNSYSSGHFW